MTAPGRNLIAVIAAAGLAACAGPPPKGLVEPTATEAAAPGDGPRETIEIPPDWRLVALRVTVTDPPAELLDEEGRGVLTLRQKGRRAPIRLVFVNGALGVHALRTGNYRITHIAGYTCGRLGLAVRADAAPLALGAITLDASERIEARLSGTIPTPEDLDRIAGLVGADPAAIEADPLERGRGIDCERRIRAVSRPDVDPTIYKPSPAEIAGGIVLLALLGGATAGAAAGGTIVFASGSGGALLFLGF